MGRSFRSHTWEEGSFAHKESKSLKFIGNLGKVEMFCFLWVYRLKSGCFWTWKRILKCHKNKRYWSSENMWKDLGWAWQCAQTDSLGSIYWVSWWSHDRADFDFCHYEVRGKIWNWKMQKCWNCCCLDDSCYSLDLECAPKTHVWKAWSPACGTIGNWNL